MCSHYCSSFSGVQFNVALAACCVQLQALRCVIRYHDPRIPSCARHGTKPSGLGAFASYHVYTTAVLLSRNVGYQREDRGMATYTDALHRQTVQKRPEKFVY